jgi:serine phosphatase RsbU (regulator of sigma subunit)
MTEPVGLVCGEVWGGNSAADARLDLPGARLRVFSRPWHSDAAGGDVHYISSCGTGRVTRMILADVAGHGMEVSEIAVFLRSVMRRYLNHIEPRSLAARVNAKLTRHAAHQAGAVRFATAVIATYFAPTGELTLCNAGHPLPLIRRRSERVWEPLEGALPDKGIFNLPLGIIEETGYLALECILNPGDALLLYTDALTEAANGQGELLGTAGLLNLLNAMPFDELPADSSAFISALIGRIESAGHTLDDDVTAVMLECLGTSNGAGLRAGAAGFGRMVRTAMSGQGVPWPEMSVRNLGGAMLPFMTRVGNKKVKTGAGE